MASKAKPKHPSNARRATAPRCQNASRPRWNTTRPARHSARMRSGAARRRPSASRPARYPDYERDPYEAGTQLTVFDGKKVRIVMTVVTALERFDHQAFVEDVEKLGLDPEAARAAGQEAHDPVAAGACVQDVAGVGGNPRRKPGLLRPDCLVNRDRQTR